jgi:hypothetical protein
VTCVQRPSTGARRDADIGTQYIDIRTARRILHWIPRRPPRSSLTALWRSASETPALH